MKNTFNDLKLNNLIAITEKNPTTNKIRHGKGTISKITENYIYLKYSPIFINETHRYKKDNIIQIDFLTDKEISEKEKTLRLKKWIELKYNLLNSDTWIKIKKYHNYEVNKLSPYLEERSQAFLNGKITLNEFTKCLDVYFKKEIYIISAEIKAGIYSED